MASLETKDSIFVYVPYDARVVKFKAASRN